MSARTRDRLDTAPRRRSRGAEPQHRREIRLPLGASTIAALVTVGPGPIRLGDLARHEGVAAATLSHIVAVLDDRTMSSARPDESDRRSSWLRSATGRALLDGVRREHARVMAERAGRLTADQAQQLADALEAIEALARTDYFRRRRARRRCGATAARAGHSQGTTRAAPRPNGLVGITAAHDTSAPSSYGAHTAPLPGEPAREGERQHRRAARARRRLSRSSRVQAAKTEHEETAGRRIQASAGRLRRSQLRPPGTSSATSVRAWLPSAVLTSERPRTPEAGISAGSAPGSASPGRRRCARIWPRASQGASSRRWSRSRAWRRGG